MVLFNNLLHFKLIYSENVDKEFQNIDPKEVTRIIAKINQLRMGAGNLDIKKLKGCKYDLYRLRCGDYRIIYQLISGQRILYIVAVGPRGHIYKNFKVD